MLYAVVQFHEPFPDVVSVNHVPTIAGEESKLYEHFADEEV